VIRDFCFNYLDERRAAMKKYETADAFIAEFSVSDAMINSLLSMAEKEKVKINKTVVKKITPQLKTRVKAQLARSLFDDDAMYKVLLETDQDFKKALQVIGNPQEFAMMMRKS
jgi:carboxyl-terminal processing protease